MASETEIRFFSIEEANRAIKELRKILPAMRRVLKEVEQMEDRLSVLDLICNRTVAADNPDLREYLASKVQYHRKISEFEEFFKNLESKGFLLRDLENGVVHFPSRRGKEHVFLCWKEGEARVSHWHTAEELFPDEGERREIDKTF